MSEGVEEPLFACLVPGRVINTDFQLIDDGKMFCEIPEAAGIKEICISLLRPDIPPDQAVGVFYACRLIGQDEQEAYQEWNYLGSLSMESPTSFYRAAWNATDGDKAETVRIGLSLETLEVLSGYVTADQIEENKTVESAKGIARDLYNFMCSFNMSLKEGDQLVIPANCIDKWLEKFEAKHRRQPFFWLK